MIGQSLLTTWTADLTYLSNLTCLPNGPSEPPPRPHLQLKGLTIRTLSFCWQLSNLNFYNINHSISLSQASTNLNRHARPAH